MVRIWDLVLQFEVFGYLVGLSEDDLSTQSCKKGHNRTAVRWIGRVQIEIGPKSVILHSQMLHGAGICTPTFVPVPLKNGTNVGVHIPAPWFASGIWWFVDVRFRNSKWLVTSV